MSKVNPNRSTSTNNDKNPISSKSRSNLPIVKETQRPSSCEAKGSNARPNSSSIASNRAKPSVKGKSVPLITGFGNSGAIFGIEDKEETLHPQVIKMARKSGTLNLSNKGMTKIPQKVFHLNELDAEESKKVTLDMRMDNEDEDRWWEQAELSRLYLASNVLTNLDPLIGQLASLQLLDLSDNRLTSLPSTISDLRCLNRLNLSHNDLKQLPDAICQLEDLRTLSLDHNNLIELPDNIGSLCVLENLDISHNLLVTLPPSIGYLQRLNKLNVSDNKIKELPLEIGDLFGLVHIDLTRNNLSSLPACMDNLPKIEEICLRQNSFTALPNLKCTSLKELYLGANKIKTLDKGCLESLSGLRVLDVSDNGLEELPDEITLLQAIQRLDLTGNYISNLPTHMGLLQHLKSMPLEGNPLRLIRRDIVQRGTTQLLKYLSTKLAKPINTYPGFADYVPEASTDKDECAHVPDQYEMRNMKAMVYNVKAKEIPDVLFENGHLALVRTADLSQNLLVTIPEKMSLLGGHLSELILNHNRLTSIPSFIGQFKYLQFLDLQNNQLMTLPSELANLSDLREVNISYNRYECLPSVLYDLPMLEILFAGDNKIEKIDIEPMLKMERLATLDLHNNNIDFVPPLLGKMSQLRTLQLEGNSFRVPRSDILAKGGKFVLEYLKSRIVEK